MRAWRGLRRIAEGVIIVLACALFGHRVHARRYEHATGYALCSRCGLYLADLPPSSSGG